MRQLFSDIGAIQTIGGTGLWALRKRKRTSEIFYFPGFLQGGIFQTVEQGEQLKVEHKTLLSLEEGNQSSRRLRLLGITDFKLKGNYAEKELRNCIIVPWNLCWILWCACTGQAKSNLGSCELGIWGATRVHARLGIIQFPNSHSGEPLDHLGCSVKASEGPTLEVGLNYPLSKGYSTPALTDLKTMFERNNLNLSI